MPTKEQLRDRLLKKLKELFQLDQPDLDFGFYRIMHVKAKDVADFIDTDLLKIVADAFGAADEARCAELRSGYEKALQTAKDFGAPNPEETEPVKKVRAALDALKDTATAEADVYDHLYRFFERYYDDGDFISRRYYARESAGKAAPFSIPYNGEEVKLHWANADQYYIKTAEYFANYSFDLTQAAEIRGMKAEERILNQIPDTPVKVQFRIVDATEGEHGNVKASEGQKRFFIINGEKPLEVSTDGELVVNFEYRVDPEKGGTQEGSWRDRRNAEATQAVLAGLTELVKVDRTLEAYLRLLQIAAPTDKDKTRPLLTKYINQYTARNSCDYFIHKDLGGFLRRELDFYIKNEVMRLDDIENADAPAVESYLSKIKVLRKIAGKLIDFLAQLENFQKKLWLKKKFVVETNYCITLDRVPEGFYGEIAANEAQCIEWVKLFAIDEIERDLTNPGFTQPLTVVFLKANNTLVLDTAFFDQSFKERLIGSIDDFDQQCDGLLIHSENFQALNLLQERYREQVKCVYIDPPYNTGNDGFAYKDSYQHSSWLSAIREKLELTVKVLAINGSFYCQLDHYETHRFRTCASELLNFEREIIWSNESSSGFKAQANTWIRGHDTIYFYSVSGTPDFYKQHLPLAESTHRRYDKIDSENGEKFKEYFEYDGSVRKVYLKDSKGKPLSTVWTDIISFQTNNAGREHVAFTTQKPTGLIERVIKASNLNGRQIILDYFAGSGTTGHAVINLNREDKGKRKYILVEMGDHFDTVLKPRITKVVYSESWKEGKPVPSPRPSPNKGEGGKYGGISHCCKYLRLESYEDTLNNLRFDENLPSRMNTGLREDFMLRYLLDVETRGSQSLLNIDAFADPVAYTLLVKKPGSDEAVTKNIDLIETFNYLLGLRINHRAAPQTFSASFIRNPDPELPGDQHTKLVVDGGIKQVKKLPHPHPNLPLEGEGTKKVWWFRKIEGWLPKERANPNSGQQEKVLIVWRNLTGDLEQDNLMLDEWFQKNRISTRDFEFDTIYVNGSNNLPNLKKDEESWKVRLIEEEFHKRMWETGE